MNRARKAVLLACLTVTVGLPFSSASHGGSPAAGSPPAPSVSLSISVSSGTPAQGDPVIVDVFATGPLDNLVLLWKGAAWPVREVAAGRYEGLIGVDLLATAGPETLVAEGWSGGKQTRVGSVLSVAARRFPVQEIRLPKRMAEFDASTLKRIREEARVLEERFARVTVPVLWRMPFQPPVEDFRPENFGSRRVINGEERSPHAAVDVRLPEGTPVRSIAGGTVVFAGDQFFGGRSVVIDHGGGVFSTYYHLRDITVPEGRPVGRGETIGAVGATGRATGPHLHFGVRVTGGRVDPAVLFALPGR
jgi:murein DD-endopeptidase MepM/ murein hydrolase activator NlpD